MSEENKAIVRRFFEEIWNEGNLEIANEIIDDGRLGLRHRRSSF
ncbi:MAG: hypothetical protein K0Q96_1697 [Rubrobacteraceae bacterium]|nr:hypothetical protein [Rubrobacteraceae bacterium]